MSVSVPSGFRHSLGSSSRGDDRASNERPFGSLPSKGNVINKSTKRRMSDSDAQPSRKKCHLMETRMDSILKIPVISLRSRIVPKQKTVCPTVPSVMKNLKNINHSRIVATRDNKSTPKRNRLMVMKRNIRKIITPPKLEHVLKYRKNKNNSEEKLRYRSVFATKSEEDQVNCCRLASASVCSPLHTDSPVNYLFYANSMMNPDEEEGFLSTSEIEQLNLDLGDTIMNDSFLNDINGEGNENVSCKSQNNIFLDDRK